MENRFNQVRDFLSEIQDEVSGDCTVSFSYGPDGFSMLVSFHGDSEVEDKEMLNVKFEESDFQDSEVYESSVIDQVKEYVNENIY